MRQIREHRKMSQADVAELLRVSTIASPSEDAAQIREVISEYKACNDSLSKRDTLGQRLQRDFKLLECVELLVQNREEVKRIMGYIDRMIEDRSRLDQPETDQRTGWLRVEEGEKAVPMTFWSDR
jgi:transcriptional regulator with XRE-family HTH domain